MPEPADASAVRPALLTAVLAAAVSVLVGAVFVVLARGPADLGLSGLLRAAARAWVVSLGSGVEADGVVIGLVPLGATALCVLVVARTSTWVVVDRPARFPVVVATTAGALGVVAGAVAAWAGDADVSTSATRAFVGGAVVGALGVVLGAGRRHRVLDQLWFTERAEVRAAVRAAPSAVVALLGVAAVLTVAQMLLTLQRAADLWALLAPGVGGGIALAGGSLLAVPNAMLWTTSVLLGPGFVVGTDTSVDLTGSYLGAVPGFPLLAALPEPGAFPGWAFLLGLVPLLAGAVAGWRLVTPDGTDLWRRVATGAGAGGVAGALVGALVGVSGGAIGPGRLVEAGPPALTPLLVAVPVIALGGALGAAASHYRGRRAHQPPDARQARRPRLWKRHQPPGPDRRDD